MGRKKVSEVVKEQAAAKEQAAQLAEQHKQEQAAADAQYRAEQLGRASEVADGIQAEKIGGTALTLAVGGACWDYTNADLLRGTPGELGRFTDSMRQLRKDISAEMNTDVQPNISRYLAFEALARLWSRDLLLTLPFSIVQDACTMVTRDDSAPGLEYTEDTTRGPEQRLAYGWVNGCEEKGPELLARAAAGAGTCQGLTLAQFTEARKEFCASGQGRHNRKGKNKGKGKGKVMTAQKAAVKLAAAVKAVKDYASLKGIAIASRIQGLGTVAAAVLALRAELEQLASQPAKGKGKGQAAAQPAAADAQAAAQPAAAVAA